jgi:DMSO/TMAO reductase YedYZ molybdopterin-dependent catalytic subunit
VSPEPSTSAELSRDELKLAARNHALPLETLRYDLTPSGLHYLLVHYDIPAVDPSSWRLELGGHVARPLSLSLDELRERPFVSTPVTLECAGNGRALLEPRPISQPWFLEAIGTAEWGGTPLRPLLEEAGVGGEAVDIVFSGIDRGIEGGIEQQYERSLSLDESLLDGPLLAYEMNGVALPPQHGYPVRLVVPGWYGMASVKWLDRITVLDCLFDGYQQRQSYRIRLEEGEEGEPVTRIMPRALMVPPGIPDFATRHRIVDQGPCPLEGRAWSGWGAIVKVEVSDDHGSTWREAKLGRPAEGASWVGWSLGWTASSACELWCRATDAAGNEQPAEARWNLGGYANNAFQRVSVTVR